MGKSSWLVLGLVAAACGGGIDTTAAPTADAGSVADGGQGDALPPTGGGVAIGGVVAGLAGAAKVQLRLNDGVPIAAGNGAFAFDQNVPLGSPYSLTAAAPDGHDCSVAGSGVATAASPTEVRVTCVSLDASLAALVPSRGTLVPAFRPTVLAYTLTDVELKGTTVISPADVLTLAATAAGPGATVQIAGNAAIDGVPSSPLALVPGDNTYDVTVTAANGVGQAHYAINVHATSSWLRPSPVQAVGEFGWVVAASAGRVVVGDRLDGQYTHGAVHTYARDESGVWNHEAKVEPPENSALNQGYCGRAVAIDGDTLVVGCPGQESNGTGIDSGVYNNIAYESGAAYVYVRSGGTWIQQAYVKASNTRQEAAFGTSVAISGDTMVIGSPKETSGATGIGGNQASTSAVDAGAAYVFTRTAGVWSQQAYLKASNNRAGALFGSAVAAAADTVIVSAPKESSGATGIDGNQSDTSAPEAGAAYVFARSAGSWSQTAYLKSNVQEFQFGQRMASSVDTLAVTSGDGRVHVFVDKSGWTEQTYYTLEQLGGYVPSSVAVVGDSLLVGVNEDRSASAGIDGDSADASVVGAGAAHLFTRTSGDWTHHAYLKSDAPSLNARCGTGVAMVGPNVAMGCQRGLDTQVRTGVLYLF